MSIANTPQLNKEILDSLSPQEREIALKALQEISTQGTSKTLDDLKYKDFKEVPVDVETFITDDRYLGKAWKDAEGKLKLYPFWMNRLKELFPDNLTTAYNTLLESGARGIGKAQPITEPVLTSKGFIPMGEIQLGDQVYGRDGKLHEVVGVFPQGKKDVYKVTFSDHSSTECCKEHLWEIHTKTKTYRRNKGYDVARRVVPLEWLFDKPLKRFFIPVCNPVQFPYQDIPVHPYLLGCLLGDGYLGKSDIRITSGDSEIISRLQQIISEEDSNYYLRQCISAKASKSDYCLVRREVPKAWNEEFHSSVATLNIFAQKIEKLGLIQSSQNKFIPNSYLYNSVEVRTQLLQGLMDTDGTIAKDGSTITFDTTSPQLRDGVIWLVQSLGGTAFYGERRPHYHNAEDQKISGNLSYCIRIKLPQSICPFSLPRKVERMRKVRKNPFRYIESVERLDQQECQCILLDSEDHLYLTKDFIVTHNSEIACGCVGAYLLYRVMCLKNPLEYFHLKQTEKICFAFMNIKLALAEEIAISKFQKTIQMSPWFMERGTITSYKNNPYWNPPDPIAFIIGSQADDVIGQPIYFAFFDEISFIRNQDVDKQKAKAKDMIDTAIGGMFTRFIHQGKNPTVLVVASSKRSEQSFMEEYIKTLSQTSGESTLVVDKPVWEVKPEGTYSSNYFYVGLGNKFLESMVIPDEDLDKLQVYRERGYKLIRVPIDFKAKFIEDIDRNLCDFAGISSVSSNKYMSGQVVAESIDEQLKNPFPDILEVGNGADDTAQYYNFFDLSAVPKDLMSKPLFVHLDMSISGDMTGIAGVWIAGKKVSTDSQQQARDLKFQLAFNTSIKAPKGRQISFEKNRNFIRWLREVGFSVRAVTSDTFQSYDLQQQLSSEGFDCEIVSVDRVTDGVCRPYQYLRSAIYEKRFKMYRAARLFDEFVDIERNIDTGKIDHSPNGHKDTLDAVCGATFEASKHVDEFVYNYGEDLDEMIQVSSASSSTGALKQQIQLDFEAELRKIATPEAIKRQQEADSQKSPFIDFGNGPAQQIMGPIVGDGLLIW